MDAIQREAARERATAEERFAGLLDRVSQTTNAQLQQIQQGMTAMMGVMTQLIAHTGLQLPQPQPQAVVTPLVPPTMTATAAPPQLTPFAQATPPATTTAPATGEFSLTDLLGSASRPIFSPIPAVNLFSDSPAVTVNAAPEQPAAPTSALP